MKKKWIQVLIAAGISLAAIGGVFAAKDSIVIYLGIRMFRLLQVGVIGAGALITGGTAVSSAVTVSRLQDQLENSRQEQLAIEEQHRRQTARLSVQGKLDNATLRRVLTQKSQDNWSLLRTQIEECITQLTSMDDYQERLRKLLESNGADMLYDTEDVLDQAEQAMCRNVRKVINYMEVADDKLAEDLEMVRGKVDTCREANQGILKQSQEFVFALTEYLNRQGDSSDDMSMLEIYKKTILESIQDGGE
ncbi:MAG: hypothetical protein IKR58_01360 [Lachnospiraceae bacterium]|nr:hypothetical protein [Lachnospiraceae bacterium]